MNSSTEIGFPEGQLMAHGLSQSVSKCVASSFWSGGNMLAFVPPKERSSSVLTLLDNLSQHSGYGSRALWIEDDTFDPEEDPELGWCCVCDAVGAATRNLIALELKAPIPGTGWGCLVCDLPCDGAVAVVCDACLDLRQDLIPNLKSVVHGYPNDRGRCDIASILGIYFYHDPRTHEHNEENWLSDKIAHSGGKIETIQGYNMNYVRAHVPCSLYDGWLKATVKTPELTDESVGRALNAFRAKYGPQILCSIYKARTC